jgi:hypothetical protein
MMIDAQRQSQMDMRVAQAAAVGAERERCRSIVVEILSEEGWLGRSLERIVDAIQRVDEKDEQSLVGVET